MKSCSCVYAEAGLTGLALRPLALKSSKKARALGDKGSTPYSWPAKGLSKGGSDKELVTASPKLPAGTMSTTLLMCCLQITACVHAAHV